MTDESSELALPMDIASDLQPQTMVAEVHDEMEDGHWMASMVTAFSAWKELLRMPIGSMPLVDEVILAEDYQTGTAILYSISNRTICEDLEVRWWDEGKGTKRMDIPAGMVTFSSQLV